MEVSVEGSAGIPRGSIVSIRAGSVRRQGVLNSMKKVNFGTGVLEAAPFTVDLFAPLASSRLILTPQTEAYAMSFGSSKDLGEMRIDLRVKEISQENAMKRPERTPSRQQERQQQVGDCQDYVEKHQLTKFMQNLMQSVLVERPDDPLAYMEQHLRVARGCVPAPIPSAAPSVPPAVTADLPDLPAAPPSSALKRQESAPQKEILTPCSKSFAGTAFAAQGERGAVTSVRPLQPADVLPSGSDIRRLAVHSLSRDFPSRKVDTPLRGMEAHFRDHNSWVSEVIHKQGRARTFYQMLAAGPRETLQFQPSEVVATVVTCGGLCPGLNAVVRQVVQMLHLYGVKTVWGIRGGYKGVVDTQNWVELTPGVVQDIHDSGGTFLSSDRGNPPIEEQAAALRKMGVRQHFVIGGDGTHRGAQETFDCMKQSGWECAVVGIPKTIDNDVPMLDRTFGFDTACTEATKAIEAAYVEATCNANCIGLVKLMGRHCGFIAMNSCLASRFVDVCLLPEMEISTEKVVQHCVHLMQTKGYAVIVVAEGCGNTMLQSSGEVDAGGNVKLADVGPWLRDKILARFKEVRLPLTIKYIDPTYMIRAVKPNSNDSVYCAVLADNAVHAAMAGYTGVTVGKISQRYVMLPMEAITKQRAKRVDLRGRWFVRLISTTMQPDFAPDDGNLSSLLPEDHGPDPLQAYSEPVDFLNVLGPKDEVRRMELEHLKVQFGQQYVPTPLQETVQGANPGFMDDDSWVTQTVGARSTKELKVNLQMLRAGARRVLHFKPQDVAAAIVTCGGLCPGLNSVIRELVNTLYAYGVRKVYGIKGGFHGVLAQKTWLTLTPESVRDIHMQGGTILVTDRGNPKLEDVATMLKNKGVRQFYVIGGDGTHRGAYAVYEAMKNVNWECSIVGVPKTIDNDIALLDRTFGFDTACSEALKSINVAYVEATCNANCIGLVKLMGRHCGYLAMMSVLSSRYADVCLLPEMDISLDKVLDHCVHLLSTQGYAVVVVAEGCGDTLVQGSGEVDKGGNKKMADAGLFLKEAILSHFKELKLPLTVKYVDPTYTVRAIPANANDSIYCSVLGQNAVHGAMAGYTGITVAKVDNAFVYLPIRCITSMPNRKVDVMGNWFERMLAATMQPNLSKQGRTSAKPRSVGTPGLMAIRRSSSFFRMDEVRIPNTKLVVFDGYGKQLSVRNLERADLLAQSTEVRSLQCFHLGERFGSFKIPSPLKGRMRGRFTDTFAWATESMFAGSVGKARDGEPHNYQMVRAGPREFLHFDPNDPASCAAIVSCGGICPGLNSVIRELVMMLREYGVRHVYGIKGGYKGVVDPGSWIPMTPDLVKDIHMQGGTMLVSDRGNPPTADMAKVLKERSVRQYFVLGGDGTHKGAMQTFEACLEIDHECAVIGVPKTIDNDVPMLDQTFGFDTACSEAVRAVDSAYVEATCNANCIGLVKLMGRHCGFIAMDAVLAARHVDICLLPEMDIDAEKVLAHTEHLMRTKRHAVIVVAEGCGDTLIKSSGETDAGGNKVLADAGLWLKTAITTRFKAIGLPLTIKYIDPTYMIRSVAANAFDSQYCAALAMHAVHASMAGYSGITVGKVNERFVYLPIHAITKQKGRRVNTSGRWFMQLLETTKQPDFTPAGKQRCCSSHALTRMMEESQVMRDLSDPGSINEVLVPGDEFHRLGLVHLGTTFPSARVPNPMRNVENFSTLGENAWATRTLFRNNKRDDRGHKYYQMLLGGPREYLHFEPALCSAVIVTCGGLCPGLNSVIREVVMTLARYGVPKIYGCRGGYKGMVQPESWLALTPDVVRNIHMQGGTILVSDRGNPPPAEIARTLQSMNVKQYFVIGGDGTHRGAMDIFKATQDLGYECSVVGIPKTIDNDIPILDRSFGFKTACTEAVKSINSAYTEATSNSNCIGLVKLMGRHCGWIALEAVLAARHVDVCLLPEMEISLPKLLTHALNVVKKQGCAVIVVAEGCGDTLIKSSGGRDAGGNKKLSDVGPWLMAQLLDYFKKMQEPLTVKFIDPTYTIRAVPANANDSVYCSVLAQQAVHGAMAGYTGISVGKVDNRFMMLPIHAITETNGSRKVDIDGTSFERLMGTTGQPNLKPGVGDEWALMPPFPPPRPEPTPDSSSPYEVTITEWRGTSSAQNLQALQEQEEIPGAKLQIFDGYGAKLDERPVLRGDIIAPGAHLRRMEVMKLSDRFAFRGIPSPFQDNGTAGRLMDGESWTTEAIATSTRLDSNSQGQAYFQLPRAGPRGLLHFDPADSTCCAAIVTCGGLCPGENAAIREIVLTLKRYGVARVYGIQHGFKGILDKTAWTELTAEFVQDIHNQGGTILKNTRGNPPAEQAAEALKKHGVRQFFALGGEGTHRGVLQILSACAKVGHECACIAVPSTINNDIPMSDRTPGFDTACTAARDNINAGYVEATCNANCIGLVKLTGQSSGFLALEATLAARNVDICLLPEMEIVLDIFLDHCEHLMATKGYAVVVVAEGCRESMRGAGADATAQLQQGMDVGLWIRDQVMGRFKQKAKPLTIKYIDPTYTVRSAQATTHDSVFCSTLAEHAVHGAMAGFTGVTVVSTYGRNVYMPLEVVTKSSQKRVNTSGRWLASLLFTTKQPHFVHPGFTYPKSSEGTAVSSISTPIALADTLLPGTVIRRMKCANLSERFTPRNAENPLKKSELGRSGKAFAKAGEWSTQTFQRANGAEMQGRTYLQMLRCGPRESLHFDPSEPSACAAIVTCGGLCPGLNAVIRELLSMLLAYGVGKVYGIRGGYNGCTREEEWLDLNADIVQEIHKLGGSCLVSDRGNPPPEEVAKVMQRRGIRQFFVLGGDGTHKGAMAIFQAMTELGHECAVVGVPKTIDNDIQVIDVSFGFDTACTEAEKAIDSAYVEATTNANCIGLVKLMGRHCGWISLMATLAARHVDVCLLPEMNIALPKLLDYVAGLMRKQRRAVIVVAEGCGDTIISGSGDTDAGGNKKLADVGPYLKDEITRHCKSIGIPLTIKYIDPTYMIRSLPANAYDSKYCAALAQEAVHAAMAGYTGISVGKVDGRYVMLPICALTDKGPRKVDLKGRIFERFLAATGQPSFEPERDN